MKSLKQIIEHSMSSLRDSQAFKEQWIASQWPESVGDQVDRRTAPGRLIGQILHVHVASSVWATQLQALKSHILKELNKRIHPLRVKDLRFQVQYPLRRPQEVKPLHDDDGETVPSASTPLDNDTEKKIDEIVQSIDEDSLRKSFHSLLTRDEQLKTHRRSLGWKACRGCGVLIKNRVLCPFCTLHGVSDTGEIETQKPENEEPAE